MGWQSPRLLKLADGRPAYVEAPIALRADGNVLLFGIPSFMWAARDAFDPPPKSASDTAAYLTRLLDNTNAVGFLVGADGSATAVRPPTISAPIQRLVAAAISAGTVRIVWRSAVAGSNDSGSEGAVWYAEYRDGQWTIPKLVFSADRFDPSRLKTTLLVGDHSDVHIITAFYRGQVAGIANISRTNGQWTAVEAPVRGLPSQVTAQFIGPDSVAIAYAGIGAPGVRQRNGQHIFLIRAALSDTLLPAPTMVQWSGIDAVEWLEIHGAASGDKRSRDLALVWNRGIQSAGRQRADTLYAKVSDNAGLTWRATEMLPLPFKPGSLAQAHGSDGNVHVVVTAEDGPHSPNDHIYHAELKNGHWSALDSVLAGPIATPPAVSRIGRDTLLIAWAYPRPADSTRPNVIAPVTKYTTFVGSCPQR